MNSQKINKNTTLQKNERETLIKKMVLKHQCDGFWTSLCVDKESTWKSAGAELKIAEIKTSLGEIPYYPFLPN